MRLLEKRNDTLGIGVCSGACINYYALHKQNGSLYGCELSLSGNVFYISYGEISIQGFRVYVSGDTEELVDTDEWATVSGTNYVYIRVQYSADEDTASYSVRVSSTAPSDIEQTQIQQRQSGYYWYCVASFVKSSSSITSWSSLVETIELSNFEDEWEEVES